MRRPGVIRALVLAGLIGLAAVVLFERQRPGPDPSAPRLHLVTTARQYGPVGYRDPVGAMSPDGQWMAVGEGRWLTVRPAGGGPALPLPPRQGQIRHLVWQPDSRRVLVEDTAADRRWWMADLETATLAPLWPDVEHLDGEVEGTPARQIHPNLLRQPAWSPDGRWLAAVVNDRDGPALWEVSADGARARVTPVTGRAGFPAWTPSGEVACLVHDGDRQRMTLPCGASPLQLIPDVDAYGPFAYTPDGRTVYFASPNHAGTVDLWRADTGSGRASPLTRFGRDTYAPSVTADGTVLFKLQDYRTFVAVAPAEGGSTRALATFQSETPSWDPAGRQIGITYGTWRRVIDDFHYPDIAQAAGIIVVDERSPAREPARIVEASASEDQSLCWSPNGRWIAFHSHKDDSDDIWLMPADGARPAVRISFLGRGAETGWPRWSPDGTQVLFDGASRDDGRSVLYVVGVDQETGAVTSEAHEVRVAGLDAEVSHGEWLEDSEHVVAVAKEAPGRHVIFVVPAAGGPARVVHRFATEHDTPGLAVSPDGRHVAFIAPAPDGYFQVFRMPTDGGTPGQVTFDPSHKTQPAWSPDGARLAFTVWTYEAGFWTLGN